MTCIVKNQNFSCLVARFWGIHRTMCSFLKSFDRYVSLCIHKWNTWENPNYKIHSSFWPRQRVELNWKECTKENQFGEGGRNFWGMNYTAGGISLGEYIPLVGDLQGGRGVWAHRESEFLWVELLQGEFLAKWREGNFLRQNFRYDSNTVLKF